MYGPEKINVFFSEATDEVNQISVDAQGNRFFNDGEYFYKNDKSVKMSNVFCQAVPNKGDPIFCGLTGQIIRYDWEANKEEKQLDIKGMLAKTQKVGEFTVNPPYISCVTFDEENECFHIGLMDGQVVSLKENSLKKKAAEQVNSQCILDMLRFKKKNRKGDSVHFV